MTTFIDKLKKSDIWDRLHHISLEEMKSVTLMNRTDTKYVAHQRQLRAILEQAAAKNYMVQFTQSAVNGYDTTYYDTAALSMYLMHHNRKLHKHKIRCRTYTDCGISFLEIKDKNNSGRTSKIRMPVRNAATEKLRSDKKVLDFISNNTVFNFLRLVPTVKTDFHRITLVNDKKTERITIDVELKFKNLMTGNDADLKDLVIIELKEDGRFVSTMSGILHDLHVKPFHISKYCIGTAMTNPQVKHNRFKRKLHLLNKIRTNYE